jgi:hypothetical protein
MAGGNLGVFNKSRAGVPKIRARGRTGADSYK